MLRECMGNEERPVRRRGKWCSLGIPGYGVHGALRTKGWSRHHDIQGLLMVGIGIVVLEEAYMIQLGILNRAIAVQMDVPQWHFQLHPP